MTRKNDLQMQKTKDEEQNKTAPNEQEKREKKIRKLVFNYMRRLGMPCHLKGYYYVTDAITWCVITPEKINGITKGLYSEIAKKYGITEKPVERAIRNAIEVAWERVDLEIMDEIFGNTISSQRGKPTNAEFIAQIAEDIRINNQF